MQWEGMVFGCLLLLGRTTVPVTAVSSPAMAILGQSSFMGSLIIIISLHFSSEVFETRFWMQHHGSTSPKRTVFMGNVATINRLDKGKLDRREREKRTKVKTTRNVSACMISSLLGDVFLGLLLALEPLEVNTWMDLASVDSRARRKP